MKSSNNIKKVIIRITAFLICFVPVLHASAIAVHAQGAIPPPANKFRERDTKEEAKKYLDRLTGKDRKEMLKKEEIRERTRKTSGEAPINPVPEPKQKKTYYRYYSAKPQSDKTEEIENEISADDLYYRDLDEIINEILNFQMDHIDIHDSDKDSPARIKRTYNSMCIKDGLLGYGWNFEYDVRLITNNDGGFKVKSGDGRLIRFITDGQGNFNSASGKGELLKGGDGLFYRSPEGIEYVFANNGILIYLRDKNGNIMMPERNKHGNIIKISDETGMPYFTFTYDRKNRIKKIKDPEGNTSKYYYDRHGDLKKVKDAEGNTYKYKYDNRHQLIKVINPDGTDGAKDKKRVFQLVCIRLYSFVHPFISSITIR